MKKIMLALALVVLSRTVFAESNVRECTGFAMNAAIAQGAVPAGCYLEVQPPELSFPNGIEQNVIFNFQMSCGNLSVAVNHLNGQCTLAAPAELDVMSAAF